MKFDKAEIENCLIYNNFAYGDREWYNVGDVIPRFLIYLEKYVSGLSYKCNEFNEREHIDLLRSEMEATFRMHTRRSEESR